MTELLQVALRSVGVVLPAAVVVGFVEVFGGAGAGDFLPFLGAMGLSLLACVLWSATDLRRASPGRVITRWVATAIVVAAGLALATTLLAPGSPPGPERRAEAVSLLLFYGVPLLVAAALGVAIGAALVPTEAKARGHR